MMVHRSRTFSGRHLTLVERRDLIEYPDDVERPLTRGDCVDGPRPCPFVSCSHHLYLDVNEGSGGVKLNFPHLEVWEMPETCTLDLADRGGMTLDEVGSQLNVTRERARQLELRSLIKLAAHLSEEGSR